jgi:hypothetical protein
VWSDGVYDGASPIIDYQISYTTTGSNTYNIFASNLLERTKIVTGLTPGQSYDFVVQSRNVIDLSEYSTASTILAV